MRLWPFEDVPSEAWLRLPSAIFGTLSVGLMWLWVRLRLANDEYGVALFAAILMAGLPFQLFYSQEARMYMLVQMLALVVLVGLERIEDRGLRIEEESILKTSILITSILFPLSFSLYAQSLSGATLLAMVILILAMRRKWAQMAFIVVGVTILYLPWLYYGLGKQVGQVAGGFWILPPGVGTVAYTVQALLWSEVSYLPVILLAPLTFFLLIGGLMHGVFHDREALAWAVVPIGLVMVVSLSLQPVLIPRVLVVCVPAWVLLISQFVVGFLPPSIPSARGDVTISPLTRELTVSPLAGGIKGGRIFRSIPLACLCCLLFLGVYNYYTGPLKWPNKTWAAQLDAQAHEDEVLYVSVFLPTIYYRDDPPVYVLRPDTEAPQAGFNLRPDCLEALGFILVDGIEDVPGERVWLVYARAVSTTPRQDEFYEGLLEAGRLNDPDNFVSDGDILDGYIAVVEK